jgi:cysteine desulfurase
MVTWFESQGGEVSYLPLNSEGIPELEHLEGLIRPETTLISVIWVNNETGVITDLSQLIPIAKKFKIPVHVDAAQAWGKLNLQLSALSPDWVTFSGHKIGAIAGCGLVYTSHPKKIFSNVLGKQDLGRRGGTENLIGIIAMGAAAGNLDPLTWSARVEPLRNRLESTVFKAIPGVIVNGGGGPRVANTLNLSFENLESEGLVMALDLEGYSVSAGSACSSGVAEPSTVLMAMGRTPAQAKAAIRISLAGEMPWEDLKGFADSLERVVGRFRKLGQSATPNTTLLRSEIGISHDPN